MKLTPGSHRLTNSSLQWPASMIFFLYKTPMIMTEARMLLYRFTSIRLPAYLHLQLAGARR